MSDYLMRADAPLSEEEWAQLDHVVGHAAKALLVGRRFITLTGPLGPGTLAVPVFRVCTGQDCDCHDDAEGGACDCGCAAGECDCSATHVSGRELIPMEFLENDFILSWRDVAANRQLGLGLELGPAGAAAAACARAEDEHIFDHLLTAEGRNTVALKDWDEPGAALENVVEATEALVSKGFYGPYALVVSPALYAKTQRVFKGMGRTVGKLIGEIVEGGMFRSPILRPNEGLVLSLGAHNLDLVIAQDLTTAYMGNEGLDHLYRVMESLVLRIKRPGAICTFEASAE
jgi:uncharacterized linocin/CFP29 family protein